MGLLSRLCDVWFARHIRHDPAHAHAVARADDPHPRARGRRGRLERAPCGALPPDAAKKALAEFDINPDAPASWVDLKGKSKKKALR